MPKKRPTATATQEERTDALAPLASPQPDAPREFADLAALRAHYGESTYEECVVLLDTPREKLAESGRRFATPRAVDDALRIYGPGTTFLLHGDADAVARVKVHAVILRAGVWCASQAERAFAAKTQAATAKRTRDKALASRADEAVVGARPVRDQLADVMRNVAGNDHDLKARINAAVTPAASGKADTTPGSAVATLVGIAREQLADTNPGVAARRAAYKLTAEYVDDCAAEAAKAVTVTSKADAPRSPADLALERIDVDVWDGLALAFMEKVVDAFTLASSLDARVPKLRFVSLRSLVERGARKPATPRKKTP